jgi:5-oxoprolinase (ATP-hydrolysing) subunit A
MQTIDLNVDLGEGGSEDARLISLASSANIACGGHAGDETTMRNAIAAAITAGVAIGAHPGYEDREHFGRRALDLPPMEIADMVRRQVERLALQANAAGAQIHHVKPHGALYLQANRDPELAAAIADAVSRLIPGCRWYVPPTGCLAEAGNAAGLVVIPEGFVDRRYGENGDLLPRSEPGAVIEDLASAVAQAGEIALNQRVLSISGNWLPLPAATLCVHGDGQHAVDTLRSVRNSLEAAGVLIRSRDNSRDGRPLDCRRA